MTVSIIRNARFGILATLSGLLFTHAERASAGIAIDIFGGMRQGVTETQDSETEKKTSHNIPGSDVGLILAYKPMMLPFQVGAYVASYSYKSDDMYKDATQPSAETLDATVKGRITGITYGPHVRAWLPLGWLQPYAEAGYLFGDQTEKVDFAAATTAASYHSEFDGSYQTQAALVGLGFRFSPIPFFGIALGYEMHMGTRSLKSAKVTNTITTGATVSEEVNEATLTSEEKKAHKFNSGAFRAGFTFGF